MINRVFHYSKDVAKKNKNVSNVFLNILVFLVLIILMALSSTYFKDIFGIYGGTISFIIILFLTLFSIVYIIVMRMIRNNDRLIAFASTEDNRVFHVQMVNRAPYAIMAGSGVGGLVGSAFGKGEAGSNIGSAVGYLAMQEIVRRAELYMSDSQNIINIIMNPPAISEFRIYEILNVHYIKETKRYYIIKCDYYILNINKIKKNRYLFIGKSYDGHEVLMNILKIHIKA